jgi:mono/diheme cytochrome c family protein
MKRWVLWLIAPAAFAADPAVAQGEKLFAASCAVGYCHGSAGAAARGPRLRDRKFEADALYKVIREGIPRTAMPGWKDRLKDADVRALVSYVLSLSGNSGTPAPAAATGANPVTAVDRPGKAVFLEHCGSCHTGQGAGAAVAGDISGRTELPASTKRVRTVKLKDGETFPSLVAGEEAGVVRVYDLTEPPPVKRSLERGEIASIEQGAAWSHPKPEPSALAQIVEFLK